MWCDASPSNEENLVLVVSRGLLTLLRQRNNFLTVLLKENSLWIANRGRESHLEDVSVGSD